MFANYLYFILALLVYVMASGSESRYPFFESLLGSLSMVALFMATSLLACKMFETRADKSSFRTEIYFGRLKAVLAFSALSFFGSAIYLFNPAWHLNQFQIFKLFPTASAAISLVIFIFMLSYLWSLENIYQRRIFGTIVSTKDYIQSNLSFPLVILITWVFIFLPNDIINALPFEGIKVFFNSRAGTLLYSILSFLFVLTAGPVLMQKIWGCKSLEDGEERRLIERMCEDLGVKYRDILNWPFFGGFMITAGVMGVFGRFRYILVTPALLKHLTKEELASVIAHEIGHVKYHHLVLYIFFLSGFFLLTDFITEPVIRSLNITHFTPVLVILILAFALYFRFFFGFVMRNFERQADAYVLTVFQSADPIIRTFKKITAINRQSEDKPNWHHFSIKERIDFLIKAEQDSSQIENHNSRVKKIVYPYLVVFAALLTMTFFFPQSSKHESYYENIVLAEKVLKGDEITIANALGDYYYRSKDFEKTVKSWSKVIEGDPSNTHALNNLAWLYLTCDNKDFHDYEKALQLAERAASLKRSKEIMDTLAEAFYKNRMFKKAVDASRESVKLSGNEKYYREQLEKFLKLADQTPI